MYGGRVTARSTDGQSEAFGKYSLHQKQTTRSKLMAEIVRAADSTPASPHAAGEGLRWIGHGFSRLGLTDHEILNREFIVYDALYEECKHRVDSQVRQERGERL